MKVAIIIPCYNEALRLQKEAFIATDSQMTFIFSNDGSRDVTLKILQAIQQAKPGTQIVDLVSNHGKGNAIQAAYSNFSPEYWRSFDWVGFMDADLATPLPEALRILQQSSELRVESLWASRSAKVGSPVQRELLRGFLGRLFNCLVRTMFKIKIYDTQCGAKFFSPQAAQKAFSQEFISRWLFDIEIYLRLSGSSIREVPLQTWNEIPGSRMRVFRDVFKIFRDLFLIRKSYSKDGEA